MSHPETTQLALYAGGDLGWLKRCQVAWHVGRCASCQAELEAFAAAREALRERADALPAGVHWEELATEMKANIHLGLEAGECVPAVEPAPARAPVVAVRRWLPALVAVTLVAVIGVWWVNYRLPVAGPAPAEPDRAEVVLKTTLDGIAVERGGAAFALAHEGTAAVQLAAGAQGSLRAGFVDEETGEVTIHHVYVE